MLGGIIPARAGSSTRPRRARTSPSDHPRACGEQPYGISSMPVTLGSSPRVRGAGRLEVGTVGAGRIIPARAGSRLLLSTDTGCTSDHPRACGEQIPDAVLVAIFNGSSPRVRGAGVLGGRASCHDGIIPARAGSSPCPPGAVSTSRDHPRACGEQRHLHGVVPGVVGSSPRVRGAVHPRLIVGDGRGIIPARAGSRC